MNSTVVGWSTVPEVLRAKDGRCPVRGLSPIARRGRLLAATAVVAVLAMVMTVLPAPAASAAPAQFYPGNFNPEFQRTGYVVGTDCNAKVGGWLNNIKRPGVGWAVTCRTPHSNISVWATLWMSPVPGSDGSPYLTTGRWVDVYGKPSVVPTGMIIHECLPGDRYWTVQLFVAVDGWTARQIDFGGTRQGSLFERGPRAWRACT